MVDAVGYRDSASPLSTIKLTWVIGTTSTLPLTPSPEAMAHLIPVPNLHFDPDLEEVDFDASMLSC